MGNKTWKSEERMVAKLAHCKRVYGSGSIRQGGFFGDATEEDEGYQVLFECKTRDIPNRKKGDKTPAKSVKIELSWLDEATEEAKSADKEFGVLTVRNKFAKQEDRIAVLRFSDFVEIALRAGLFCLKNSECECCKCGKRHSVQ